jgi:hypothetical protein
MMLTLLLACVVVPATATSVSLMCQTHMTNPNPNPPRIASALSWTSAARMNGVEAAASAALKLSDVIFAYETGDANALGRTVGEFLDAGDSNVYGRTPTYVRRLSAL